MSPYALGIDLGGSSIKAVAVTASGNVLAQDNRDFEPGQALNWAEVIRRLLSQFEEGQGAPAQRIGLSAPGLVARDGRSIAHMPGRLGGLEGLDWTTFLAASHPVPVLNDAHAALLGEAWIGAAAGLTNVFMLTLGTGVGGAAIVDGHLLRGQIGRAGHLGHLCLRTDGPPGITGVPGSLEYMIGNYSIEERTGGRFQSTHQLIGAHLAGHPDATRVWLASVRALACGVASLINILDPEAVVLGGGIARGGDALFTPLAQFLEEMEWRPGGHRVQIRPAKLGEFAGAVGAAFHATRQGWEGLRGGEGL